MSVDPGELRRDVQGDLAEAGYSVGLVLPLGQVEAFARMIRYGLEKERSLRYLGLIEPFERGTR